MLNVLQFHGPESRAANDAEESPFRFVAYSIDELKAAIRDTVAAVDSTVRVVSVNRDRLLPLLEELKVSTTGIRPCTLRKWRQRARVDGHRMREILFDEAASHHAPVRAVELESPEVLLAQAAVRLAKAVLTRDIRFATQLAQDILESAGL